MDGAHANISAGQAVAAILGGKTPPDDAWTDEQFAEWIRSSPEEPSDFTHDVDGYSEAARWLAGCYLRLIESGVSPRDDALWDAMKAQGSEKQREVMSEFSGFMVGWAVNAARHVLQMPPVRNPALMEIET